MSGRNKNGLGTLYRRQDGRYEFRLPYIDENGERKRKSFYGETEEECFDQADDFVSVQEMKNEGIDCTSTIPDLLRKKFKDDFDLNFVSEAGYDRNLATLKRIENAPLGSVPIINITERHLESFMKSMTRYSNSVIAKTHQQLKLAFDLAVEEDIVGKNLMSTSRRLARRPKSIKPDRIVKGLTEDEQRRLLEALKADKVPRHRNNYKAQILIELYTGMRMGEINALKKEDIDFDKRIIHVRRTITRGLNERFYLKESAKTETGIREVPMNDLVKPVLEEAVRKAPRNKFGLVFFDTNKKEVVSTQQVNCYFKRLCAKAGIEVRGQHALRHSFATRCIEAGVPAVVLKTWMGHTNIHITLDTYADVFSRMNNESMKKFEDYAANLAI